VDIATILLDLQKVSLINFFSYNVTLAWAFCNGNEKLTNTEGKLFFTANLNKDFSSCVYALLTYLALGENGPRANLCSSGRDYGDCP
jgi:hypothetical protein